MNLENINHAINIMKRAEIADSLHMVNWQCLNTFRAIYGVHSAAPTEEALHSCGNKACFAGHVATSVEFHNSGGYCDLSCGAPNYYGTWGVDAIQKWLGIGQGLAHNLVYGDTNSDLDVTYSKFYQCDWNKVTAPMVIAKLELIKSGELL